MKKFASGLLTCILAAGLTATATPNPGWKLGVQAYSFRNGTFFQAVDLVKGLGLKYIEAYPEQAIGGGLPGMMDYHMDADTRAKVLDYLKKQGVTLISYGVVETRSPEDWRKIFDFAKAMKLHTLVSEPRDAQIPLVSSLADEYHIDVAIHDEPRPDHYWTPDSVLAVLPMAGKRVGDCADIGHWAYSGLNVVECLKKMQGRIMELHFKDVGNREPAAEESNVVWGTGHVDIKAVMRELMRQHFHGMIIIEYENNPTANVAQIRQSLDYYKSTLDKIGK
jgi:sugar phosphate isomerase/epimerase